MEELFNGFSCAPTPYATQYVRVSAMSVEDPSSMTSQIESEELKTAALVEGITKRIEELKVRATHR